MKTLFFSHTELEILTDFWNAYGRLQADEHLTDAQKLELQRECNEAIEALSPESSETFLTVLDDFEIHGTEFQVRIAPDDVKLVS